MKIQTVLAAAALAAAASTGASAATMHHVMHHPMKPMAPMAKSLASPTAIALEKQYAWAAPHHTGAFFYHSSQWFEARGIDLANQGMNIGADFDLRTALLKIGVWPKA